MLASSFVIFTGFSPALPSFSFAFRPERSEERRKKWGPELGCLGLGVQLPIFHSHKPIGIAKDAKVMLVAGVAISDLYYTRRQCFTVYKQITFPAEYSM